MNITTQFLMDGDNRTMQVAQSLADFIAGARKSVHIAIYHFNPSPEIASPVLGALKKAADKGVDVRIAYDHTKQQDTPTEGKGSVGSDPAARGTDPFLKAAFGGSKVQIRPIAGNKLMHNKYCIRDGNTPQAEIWTGSTNWTDEAWTYQDNNIIVLPSPELSGYYEKDFETLWVLGNIRGTGKNDGGAAHDGPTLSTTDFSPGDGKAVEAALAHLIVGAKARVYIASMVLSSGAVLSALAGVVNTGTVPLKGIYDSTQTKGAMRTWAGNAADDKKSADWETVKNHLQYKNSIPFEKGGLNFMHDKLCVADDAVLTGSFNFSLSATENAENIVIVHDEKAAQDYVDYINRLIGKYGKNPDATSQPQGKHL